MVGQTVDFAAQSLAAVQLGLTRVDEFNDQPVGTVLRIGVEEGTEVPRDTPIEVVVSKGPELFPIPDLQGKTGLEATQLLESQGFRVSQIINSPSSPVVGQTPQAGELHIKGTAVQLLTSR